MTDIRTASLLDVVPDSIRNESEIVALSAAIDPELRAVSVATAAANIMANIDGQPAEVIDEIAWGMRLHELQAWDIASLAKKKAFLKNVFKIRKRSGTTFTLGRVLELLDPRFSIVEWWQDGAAAHTYRIRFFADDTGINQATQLAVPEIVRRFARASQWLREFGTEADSAGALHLYPAVTAGYHITIPMGGP